MKSQTKQAFAIIFAGLVVLTAMFAYGMISRPCWGIGFFLVVFSMLTLIYAYMLFSHSSEWFRSRDVKSEAWLVKHPRLTIIIIFIFSANIGWDIIKLIDWMLNHQ